MNGEVNISCRAHFIPLEERHLVRLEIQADHLVSRLHSIIRRKWVVLEYVVAVNVKYFPGVP